MSGSTILSYHPSTAYIQATIDLAYGIVDEIHSCAERIPVERNWHWYQIQIAPIDSNIKKFIKKHLQFQENLTIQSHIDSLQKKIRETTGFIIDKHVVALQNKVINFHTCLCKSSNLEIATHQLKIKTIIDSFNKTLEEHTDDEDLEESETQKTFIEKIQNQITVNSQLFESRLAGYEHKDDGAPPPSSDFLAPFLEQNTDKAPQYRPLKKYFLCRAGYRIVRIKEYSICLGQQEDGRIYRKWLERSLKQEAVRINGLERSARRAGQAIPVQIAECKTVLKQVQEELQKKLS